MGLTLHYQLRLPGARSRADVLEILTAVRERAAKQFAEYVSPVFDLSDGNEPLDELEKRARYLLMFATECVVDIGIEIEEGPKWLGDDRSTIGFTVYPGEGAEPATFALLRRRQETAQSEEWYWWCACKTQYASNEGEEHFVKTHTALIAMLDAAREAGIELEVHDEGDFWETRSIGKLVGHVRQMNHILAKFGGALSDSLGEGHDVKAPIFDHPEFEHIEMREGIDPRPESA